MIVRTAKTLRNIVISTIVLLMLFAGAGVAYVLYTGQEPVNTATEAPKPPERQLGLPKPSKPAPNAPVGAAVASLISPVKAGTNSSIAIKTTPTANCTISVTYNNIPSKDSGLVPKSADAYGSVAWAWTVDSTAPVGSWPIKVTCTYNSRSAVVQADLQVVK